MLTTGVLLEFNARANQNGNSNFVPTLRSSFSEDASRNPMKCLNLKAS